MKTAFLAAAVAWFAAGAAAAASTTETELANQFFSTENPKLTAQEKAGLDISHKWIASTSASVKPVPGPDGTIRFLYGQSQPSIVCAVLQVCDVELEPGEQVSSVNLGDAVRWLVEPAVSGAGDDAIQHLVIKPLDVGLETSLMVTTDRRTYHLRLRSHRTEYMPRVAFSYPESVDAKWAAMKKRTAQAQASKPSESTGTNEYLGNLDFRYRVTGNAPFKPSRVYNDGVKTIIEMPKTFSQGEAPTLLVVRDSGSVFKKDDEVMVNYRLQDGRYIVDTLFEKAVLVTGVGVGQRKITIERRR
ncbi:P-type conjugative transfer protein TrbG [Luteibacter flocculans]|uniref:P-type conjugative transfer protein TrbG n=1 Tax=Luteibacter flocculans TaxID=2780091 RepID=A0ABY4T6S4_9GAMM|nr:P-type conjugative transfer protein TrbG [Luteibacter flocculans]URL58456.1 P-type conjugative transfer protein TrbG [Luteibacter flocculans]